MWLSIWHKLTPNSTARDESGLVTAIGKDITGSWLEKSSEGLDSPVPLEVANKLRRKEFISFYVFRKAFWKAIGDKELMSQFTPNNQELIRQGFAPFTRFKE